MRTGASSYQRDESMTSMTASQMRQLVGSRKIERVVVLGANGTMGYGSAALFTQAVPEVTFLARTQEKAEEGLAAAIKQVRSPTVASRAKTGSYDKDLAAAVAGADLIFEALTEDMAIKKDIFDKIEAARSDDSIVATVTSGLSINSLCEGRSESFRKNFLGLHFFNPPNVIVGTELIAGKDTDPALVDFIDAFSQLRLGREMVRTHDTPAFAGNRVGFKVMNECAQLAGEIRSAVGGQARRAVHRPRDDAARYRRPRRLGHPPGDRRQRLRKYEGRGPRDEQASGLHGRPDGEGRARQQVRRRLLQAGRQEASGTRSRRRATTPPKPTSSSRTCRTSTRFRRCTGTAATTKACRSS